MKRGTSMRQIISKPRYCLRQIHGWGESASKLSAFENLIQLALKATLLIAGLFFHSHFKRRECLHCGNHIKRVNKPGIKDKVSGNLKMASHRLGNVIVKIYFFKLLLVLINGQLRQNTNKII